MSATIETRHRKAAGEALAWWELSSGDLTPLAMKAEAVKTCAQALADQEAEIQSGIADWLAKDARLWPRIGRRETSEAAADIRDGTWMDG